MKQLFFLLTLMSILNFGSCQTKNNIFNKQSETTKKISIETETQMANLFLLLQQAKIELQESKQISVYDAVRLNQFADSILFVLQKQYNEMHPKPDTSKQKK